MTNINSVVMYFLWRNRDMKKSLKLALAGVVFCGTVGTAVFGNTEQSAEDARSRLGMLASYFSKNGLSTFANLNGNGENSTSHGKNRDNVDSLEYGELFNNGDPRSTITCIEEGNWAVNQMTPLKVGTSAVSGSNIWYDGQGHQMVPKIVKALGESPDGWAVVEAVQTTQNVKNPRQGLPVEQRMLVLAVRSDVLLGKKNDTGKKFFCATNFEVPDGTDWHDAGSSWEGREGGEPGPGHHHHHKKGHKHHAKHHHKKHHEKAVLAEDKEGNKAEAAPAA